jgi:hypothetical protein
MAPPAHSWLLFAAGALSYGVACLWCRSRNHEGDEADGEERTKQIRRQRRRRRRAAAAAAAVRAAVAAAAAAVTATTTTTTSMEQQPQECSDTTYCPLRDRVLACQARWVLEELSAAAAAEEEEADQGEADAAAAPASHHGQGRHAARAVEMLAAGYGSGLGGEDAARWARVAWALQTGRRPAAADLAAAAGGAVRRRRRSSKQSGDNDPEDDRTDDALASSGSSDDETFSLYV